MRKNLLQASFIAAAILFSVQSKAQNVGINTTDPKATLDITGKPEDASVRDGLLVPRITATQLKAKNYTTDQKGALIYVTEAFSDAADATDQVAQVTSAGLYQFDGTEWVPFAEKDTLETVMNRGNYAPKRIEFEKTDSPMSLYYKNSNFWISDKYDPSQVTGERNYMIGTNTGENLTTGHMNILIGSSAGNYLTAGARNTFVGSNAGFSIRGSDNTAIGALAGQGIEAGVDAVATTLIGSYAGYSNSGSFNTALGTAALYRNTTGGRNTAIGSSALLNNVTGRFNAAVGSNAGLNLEGNGSFNVFLGENVFSKIIGNTKINGNKNVYIGFNAGGGTNGDNNVFIGAGAGFAPGEKTTQNVNNRLVIHNQVSFADAGDMTNPPTIGAFDSVNNGLIIGDFSSKWVKFNGAFKINPSYMPTATNDYSSVLLQNPTTGDVGVSTLSNVISNAGIVLVPTPPASGNYVLKAVNGTMQWVAE